MADNLTVNQGSGTTVATEDEGGVHYPVARPHCRLSDVVSGVVSNADGASFQVIAAQGVGIAVALTTIILCNTSAVDVTCDIKDGAATKATVPVPAGGGAVLNLPVPLLGTVNTAWNCDPSAAATSITCTLVGFKTA